MFIFQHRLDLSKSGSPQRSIHRLLAFSALVAIAATTRPYKGLVHDARLYFVQVTQRMQPEVFSGDLFLAFGSQDSFSIFSALYAPLVGALGAAHAAVLYVALFTALWIGAVGVLTQTFVEPRTGSRLATFAAIASVSHYGAYQVFAFGEPFASPRLMAEALGLIAIVALEKNRQVLGVALLMVALAVHPLMTLPVACWMCARHLRIGWLFGVATLATLVGALLAFQGVDPFARVLQTFDAEWFAVIEQRLEFALPNDWNAVSWLSSALPLAGLLYSAIGGNDERRRLARSLLVVACVLLAVSWFGSISRNVLLVNLQLWRVLWIVGVIGTAMYAITCVELWRQSVLRYALLLALILAVMERLAQAPPVASGALAVVATAAAWVEQRNKALSRVVDLTVAALACLSLCVAFALIWAIGSRSGGWPWLAGVVIDAAIVAVASSLLVGSEGLRHARAASLVAALLGVVALARWDRRNDLHRYIETGAVPNATIQRLVDGKTVYWEDGVELLWLQYKIPSYYSCLQGAGVMFYAETAREYQRRGRELARLNGGGFESALGASCAPTATSSPSADDGLSLVASVCQQLGDVDLLILPRVYAGTTPAASVDVGMMRHRKDGRVYFAPGRVHAYNCTALRS